MVDPHFVCRGISDAARPPGSAVPAQRVLDRGVGCRTDAEQWCLPSGFSACRISCQSSQKVGMARYGVCMAASGRAILSLLTSHTCLLLCGMSARVHLPPACSLFTPSYALLRSNSKCGTPSHCQPGLLWSTAYDVHVAMSVCLCSAVNLPSLMHCLITPYM
jgi:hypothetical protein